MTTQPRAIVSAIIEKEVEGVRYVYLQVRWKPKTDPINSGTLEIPAGGIYPYEEVHNAIKREVREECGLTITAFIDDFSTEVHASSPGNSSIAFRPFICQQSIKNDGGVSWVGYVFRCHAKGVVKVNPSEAKGPQWISLPELRNILNKNPERIFSLQLAALRYYVSVVDVPATPVTDRP